MLLNSKLFILTNIKSFFLQLFKMYVIIDSTFDQVVKQLVAVLHVVD